jgi:hypothetical protein
VDGRLVVRAERFVVPDEVHERVVAVVEPEPVCGLSDQLDPQPALAGPVAAAAVAVVGREPEPVV